LVAGLRYKIPGDSSEDEPEPEPPGSPEPSNFMVAGPGLAGGAAGTPAILTITARDSNRRRITEGGNNVSVTVFPGQGVGNDVSPVEAAVTDRGDGSYVARFTVDTKGNYTIKVGGWSGVWVLWVGGWWQGCFWGAAVLSGGTAVTDREGRMWHALLCSRIATTQSRTAGFGLWICWWVAGGRGVSGLAVLTVGTAVSEGAGRMWHASFATKAYSKSRRIFGGAALCAGRREGREGGQAEHGGIAPGGQALARIAHSCRHM
jgi:hypothetical protein